MPKTSLSFSKFKRPYHLLLSVSALCWSQETLQASQIATLDDRLQTDQPCLARTRNTQSRMSTRLDVQDVSLQQAYDLESGLKRLHQKVLQTTAAEQDVYSQAQQALRKFQTSAVHSSQDMAIPSFKNLIDHLLPPEVLINTIPSWRESLLVKPILSDDNFSFGVVQERLKELQDIQKYVNSAHFQKGLLSDLKAAQQGYQSGYVPFVRSFK